MTHESFALALDLEHGYTQAVTFDDLELPTLVIDEPPPLGAGAGPNPARVLGAAVGSCLGASLLFCLRKGRVDVHGLSTTVRGTLARNERGRLRIASMDVLLEPRVPVEQHDRVPRCLAAFEDYCVVTASIRAAIPVSVRVEVHTPVPAETAAGTSTPAATA